MKSTLLDRQIHSHSVVNIHIIFSAKYRIYVAEGAQTKPALAKLILPKK
jgi:hypothetical protein